MDNVLKRFADSKENEADDIELDGKQYNANSSNIGNNRLNKMKRQIMKRGQYQDVDQKCLSSRSFNDLMNSNQLFKELKGVKKTGAGHNTLKKADTEQKEAQLGATLGMSAANPQASGKEHTTMRYAEEQKRYRQQKCEIVAD